MTTTIIIEDKRRTSGEIEHIFALDLPGTPISGRDLLRTRVSQEVEAYDTLISPLFQDPIFQQPDPRPKKVRKARSGRRPDSVDRILALFESHGFVILVDGQPLLDLDQSIQPRPAMAVTFLGPLPAPALSPL